MKNDKTVDPDILIEEKREGYVRYRRLSDNRRWEVHGTCDKRGDCLIGSIIDGVKIEDHNHLKQFKIEPILDVPVTPEFNTCCGSDIFKYVEL